MGREICIPPEWERLAPSSLQGTILVIGATDTGKSTFARYIFSRLAEHYGRVAYLDCDVGQSTLGPPTTMAAAFSRPGEPDFPPKGETSFFFVGSISPRGYMLPTVIGAYKLREWARERGAKAIVIDTTGLVDRAAGGGALKQWKIELLEPEIVIAFARGMELEHILWPWRRDERVRVIELPVSSYVNPRGREERIEYRRRCWQSYFSSAEVFKVPLRGLAIFNLENMAPGRLLAFQDGQGFSLALGVVREYERETRTLSVFSPLTGLEMVRSLRFSALNLDPESGHEWR